MNDAPGNTAKRENAEGNTVGQRNAVGTQWNARETLGNTCARLGNTKGVLGRCAASAALSLAWSERRNTRNVAQMRGERRKREKHWGITRARRFLVYSV